MEYGPFDQIADAVLAVVPAELGELHVQARRWGIKVWFDAESCPREHYEAQVIPARLAPGAEVLAIEIGFHAEHPKAPDNDAVLAPIAAAERSWRKALGDGAQAGPFLGRGGWVRVSETWVDPDLGDPELPFEVADRLATYIEAIEPLR